MKNKGLVEGGILFILSAIVSVVVSTGILFSGANPQGSGLFVAVSALTAYSQMPHVKHDFRVRKAIEQCESLPAASDCQEMVDSWDDNTILAYIRDDDTGPSAGNGGNFVNGYMN